MPWGLLWGGCISLPRGAPCKYSTMILLGLHKSVKHHEDCHGGIIPIRNPIFSENPGVSLHPFETRPQSAEGDCLVTLAESCVGDESSCAEHLLCAKLPTAIDCCYLLNNVQAWVPTLLQYPNTMPHHTYTFHLPINPLPVTFPSSCHKNHLWVTMHSMC